MTTTISTERGRLFDADRVEKYSGSCELVLAESIECAWCGPTTVVEWSQPALFRHAGYGAVQGFRVRSCRCGAIRLVSEFTTNPRALVA